MTFGHFLKLLREQKGLSLRELAQLSGQDHAYIYRLETGDKSKPSPDVIKELVKSLKPDPRRNQFLHFLLEYPEVDDVLAKIVLEDQTIRFEDFESAARASFRGARPSTKEQWLRYLKGIQELRESIENG